MKRIIVYFLLIAQVVHTSSYRSDDETSSNASFSTIDSKKSILRYIRGYLKADEQVAPAQLNNTLKALQRHNLDYIQQKYQDNFAFQERVKFLQHIKYFLTEYLRQNDADANHEINLLNNDSVSTIAARYQQWCHGLTRDQMLEIIHQHEIHDRGFLPQDADVKLLHLKKLPISDLRDVFMDYQRNFVIPKQVSINNASRESQMQAIYNQQRSSIQKIPIVHNIVSVLPRQLADLSNNDLYALIEQKMKDLGFSDDIIQHEIKMLQSASVSQLQQRYPHFEQYLQHVINLIPSNKPQSEILNKVLQNILQWGSTASMVASYGLQAAGYDSSLLDTITGLTLLDTNLNSLYGVTKRQLLSMIYAQYASFDELKHAYMNVSKQPETLETKSDMIAEIMRMVDTLNIPPKSKKDLERSYQTMSQQELAQLQDEMKYFVQHPMKLSVNDKKIMVMSKEQLLQAISQGLVRLKVTPEDIDKQTKYFQQQDDIKVLKAGLSDVQQALQARKVNFGVMPQFQSTMEKSVYKTPRVLVQPTIDYLHPYIQKDYEARGKSPAYVHWKTEALRNHVNHESSIDIMRPYRVYSMYKSLAAPFGY